jgi:hypothetical protein
MLVSSWFNSFWAWALYPFLIGWSLPRRRALATGTGGLLLAVCSYYLLEASSAAGPLEIGALLHWSVAAAAGAPIMVALGSRARRHDAAALIGGLGAPAVMIWSAATHPAIWVPVTGLARATVLAAALGLITLLIVRALCRKPAAQPPACPPGSDRLGVADE